MPAEVAKQSDAPLVPPVLWAQQKDLVYVNIQVEDCKEPLVKLEKDKIYFKGNGGTDKKDYEITLELFAEIDAVESKYFVRDRGTEFILKRDGPYWKRLLKDARKPHWLKVDFNKWKDESDSETEPDAAGAGGMPGMGGMGGMPGMGGMGGMPGMGGPGGGQGDFEAMMRQMGDLGAPGSGDNEFALDGDDKESDDEDVPDLE